jgi:hypothetical protein
MYRPIIAFVVAALVVPVFYAVVAYRATSNEDMGYAILVAGSTVVSCVATLFLGAPAYLFLQAKKWTAFWIAPLAGSSWRSCLGTSSTCCWGWFLYLTPRMCCLT